MAGATSGSSAPRKKGTSSRLHSVRIRPMLRPTCSTPTLPCTPLTPISSTSGAARASMRACSTPGQLEGSTARLQGGCYSGDGRGSILRACASSTPTSQSIHTLRLFLLFTEAIAVRERLGGKLLWRAAKYRSAKLPNMH